MERYSWEIFKRFVVKIPSVVLISIKHPGNTDTVACPPGVLINRVSLLNQGMDELEPYRKNLVLI